MRLVSSWGIRSGAVHRNRKTSHNLTHLYQLLNLRVDLVENRFEVHVSSIDELRRASEKHIRHYQMEVLKRVH